MPEPSIPTALDALNQAQRERLAFIDFKVYFCGEFRRADLENRFGIAPAAATRDLTAYRSLAPRNLAYDPSAKIYALGDSFAPLFELSPDRALTWLRQGFGDGLSLRAKRLVLTADAGLLAPPPLDTLASLSRAIHQGSPVTVTYLSLSSGASRRPIVPLALVENGLRWHVRAYDRKNGRFGDFVVGRITQIEQVNDAVADHERIAEDIQWNRVVELELVPHPGLEHPEAVAADYGMTDGVLRARARAAVVGYALRRWQVDCSTDHSLPPNEHHLWLRNTPTLYGVESAEMSPGYRCVPQTEESA
ncbi:WYL domain-containing protein [Caballeronia humi]|uniref:Transcriptional regulator-like protein n=1 Tax=Caballeronia humi TaxID=326474 RepID=A0A158IT86_9BURK|nr:WYL domain-containing protein [Caballeronia humi]SAL59715.1 transcriptional regulator-like protein [Caballeronia humi]